MPETERHMHDLEEAKWRYDGCLSHVSQKDWVLVVATHQIDLGKKPLARED